MAKYKEEEIAEKLSSFFYRNLPVIAFVLGAKILDEFVSWPLAVGVACLLGFGVLGYWIPERPKRGILNYVTSVVVFCVVLSAITYITIWLGWIKER